MYLTRRSYTSNRPHSAANCLLYSIDIQIENGYMSSPRRFYVFRYGAVWFRMAQRLGSIFTYTIVMQVRTVELSFQVEPLTAFSCVF